jgi:hypothetical protein
MDPIANLLWWVSVVVLVVLCALAILTPVFIYSIHSKLREALKHLKSVDENLAGLRQAMATSQPAGTSEVPAAVSDETSGTDETLFTFTAPNGKPVRAALSALSSGCEVKIHVDSAPLTSRRFGTRIAAEAWANSERKRLGGNG